MRRHFKRIAVPKSWAIKRREHTFVTKQNPGPHSLKLGIPLKLALRDILGIAKTSKEAHRVLYENEILVDGIRRKDLKFPVGIMDVIEFKKTGEHFRVMLDRGKIHLIGIDKNEGSVKPCKIIGKTLVKGKLHLNLYDGKNILVDKGDYKVGDTIVVGIPKHDIKEHIKLEKGCTIYLIGGKHIGDIGRIEDIIAKKITYKNRKGEIIETLKRYIFVIGKEKPAIKLEKPR
jgi:small subunit ribosomal protein S4e